MPSGKLYTESQMREHRATELIELAAMLQSSNQQQIKNAGAIILARLPNLFDAPELHALTASEMEPYLALAKAVRQKVQS